MESSVLLFQGFYTSPKQVRQFDVRARTQRRDSPVVQIVARPGGFFTTILEIFGIDTTSTLTATESDLIFRTGSLAGRTMDVIPLRNVASIHVAHVSRAFMVFAMIPTVLAALGALAAGVEAAAIGGLFVLAVELFVYFSFGQRYGLSVYSTGGTRFSLMLKATKVNGQLIDGKKLEGALNVVRDLIMRASGGGGSMAPVAVGEPLSLDEDHEPHAAPLAEEVYEVVAIEEEDTPSASTAKAPAVFEFGEPTAQHDPESEARELFRQGAEQFKGGQKKAALATWERLVRLYPSTQAGQAAMRNLEKLRGQ